MPAKNTDPSLSSVTVTKSNVDILKSENKKPMPNWSTIIHCVYHTYLAGVEIFQRLQVGEAEEEVLLLWIAMVLFYTNNIVELLA